MAAQLRLADLLTGLSIVSDLGFGFPVETAMRSCIIGTGLARRLGVPEPEVADVFYVSLLMHVGCVAYSHETAELFGDDLAMNHAAAKTNLADLREVFSTLIPEATGGLPTASRLTGMARMTLRGRAFGRAHDRASCEVARAVARRIGLPDGVSEGLYDVHEWWNGRGERSLSHDAIARPARIARVASEAAFFASRSDAVAVTNVLRRRSGKTLDPNVVDLLMVAAADVLHEAASGDPRSRVLEIEPEPVVEIPENDIVSIAAAFGDLADLKTPFMHGHSPEVARLSTTAGQVLGFDGRAVGSLGIAALLHDLGRVGISNRVWEKPGPLTTGEWEQVRMYPYHGERVLASTPVLRPLAAIVGMHHERMDGSGYHRGCRAAEINVPARVVAVAEAFQAMTARRPHRQALEPERARDELLGGVRAGHFDPEVVAAVLEAAGQPRPARQRDRRPSGLSDREIEVLVLLADGHSNPEIGRRLGISRRTAEHHVQHIYTKIGVSTRPAAALFALEHGLLTPASSQPSREL